MHEGYGTPEEAARGSTPAKFVHVIGVVVRGDRAMVAQLMNDVPPHEVETAYCELDADGRWQEGSSGNSTGGFLPTGERIGTFMDWDEAPDGAVAARFVCGSREQRVPVVNGCALAVFDDVEVEDEYLAMFDSPDLVAWIYEDGREEAIRRREMPRWMRERMRRLVAEFLRGDYPPM